MIYEYETVHKKDMFVKTLTHDYYKMKAMLGMLGGGENISENLSGCLFTLGVSLHKGMGEQTEIISEAGGFQMVGQLML